MLDQRARTLLKTLIERYIAEGQPIGSRMLLQHSGLELSPATIRNVMADLEELGLITSPHTSSGRIPTARGYRFFVDTLLTVSHFQSPENVDVEDKIQGQIKPDQPQRVMCAAAHVLSDLSQFASVVTAPRRACAFCHIEFLRLSESRILLIMVSPDGDVQNRILFADRPYSSAELVETANFLNQNYAGLSFDEIRIRLRSELQQLRTEISNLMQSAVELGFEALTHQDEQMIIAGERNLLENADLSSNMDKIRQLFALFEQKTELIQLLDITNRAQGIKIFIGGESQLVPIDEMAVVTSPYRIDGQVVGTVGVIGPMRMAYERVIPIVDITAKLLSNALSQN